MRKAALFLLLLPVLAQDHDVGRPYWVSTPPAARNGLDGARKAASDGDAARAARQLQAVFDEHPFHFVTQPGSTRAYMGARQRAVELLRALGAEVRAKYEEIYGPRAEEALRRSLASDDAPGLRGIIRRYEATPAGLAAIIALADRSLQRGHPAEARLLLARIPQLHPLAMEKDESLRRRLEIAVRRDAEQGGPALDGEARETGWPMLGGDATRTRASAAVRRRPGDRIAEPTPLPAYELGIDIEERASDEPIQPERGFGSRRGRNHAEAWQLRWREYAPIAPAVSRGRLVYCDGRRVVALNLYTGDELWQYPAVPDLNSKGRTNVSQLLAPTIVDGTVYATIEVKANFRPQYLQTVPITYYIPQRRLVALDLETGEARWTHEQVAADEPPLKRLSIVGVPLVRGDRIYAPAAYSEGTIHTHLLAVDRHTGRPVYATPLSNGQQELNLFGRQLNELVTTPVAEADGQILFGTNLGIVCAVDAVLGSPLWARSYRILPIPSTFLWFEAPRRWPELENSAPLVVGDRVIVAPADGRSVHCYHRRTGRELWEIGARHNDLDFRIRRIHGTDGERVFLGGDSGVLALWIDHDEESGREAGRKAWRHPFPADVDGAGRGFLAKDGLWIPTYTSVIRIDPETGRELPGSFEREGDDYNQRVHLTWADGALIATGRDFLTVRYRREDVLRLAHEGVRRDPQSPEARLAAGDIHLAVGEYDEAARRYREGLERARRLVRPRAERRAQAGLHSALLRRAFAQLDEAPDRAPAAFDAAFKAAPDADREWAARRELEDALHDGDIAGDADWRLRNLRQIESRFGDRTLDESGRTVRGWSLRRMAELHDKLGDPKRAVADLQQLLERNPEGPDGIAASDAIARILRGAGQKIYEPFEERARALFDSTLKSGNLDALERGLRMYANAKAAEDATLELAARRLRNDEPDRSAAVLQRFLLDRPQSPRVADALRLLFRAYHARKSYGPALAALQRLRRSHPRVPIARADGARIEAGKWADGWLEKEPYAALRRSAHRLDLEPPLTERFARGFNGQYVDVPDLLGKKPAALRDAVIVRLGDKAIAIDARNGREMYRLDFSPRPPQGPFVLANDRLVATTDQEIFVFDSATGRLRAREKIPRGDEGLRLQEHRGQVFLLSSGLRQRGRGTLRVSAIDPDTGKHLWTRSIPRLHPGERYNERFVTVQADRMVILSSGAAHITVLDTSSGALETRIAVNDGNAYPIPLPIALPDGRILVGFGSSRNRGRMSAYQRSYEVLLLDPARSGEDVIVWRYRPASNGSSRHLVHLQVAGASVFILERAGLVTALNLNSGQLLHERPLDRVLRENLRLADNQPLHDSLLLLVARGTDELPPRLFALQPHDLTLKYSLDLALDSTVRPVVVRSDGVVTVALVPRAGLRRGLRFQIVDPLNARRIQELKPRVGDASWFNAKVQNGILLVTLADRLVAYGPK
ncbi:MAG: outer membrane protein assembly factor BamB family protein [Planctomycetota bacterium]